MAAKHNQATAGHPASLGVPLLDLKALHAPLVAEFEVAMAAVVASGSYILGPNVSAFEEEMAAYSGAGHAIGVANGTDALFLALKAMGVGPGDEVVTTPFTFIASADCIAMTGATPVFVDIDPHTFNIDPERLADAIGPRTRAVIPVHLYGQPADMEAIMAIASDHGIRVLEDNAQALGSQYGKARAGSIGDAAALSFFPSKNLGCLGDGGMVLTSDAELAASVRRLRAHGTQKKYYSVEAGINSRLDELQAAILRIKLPHLEEWNARRAENAAVYDEVLAGLTGIATPAVAVGRTHIYHQYTVRLSNRDLVARELAARGIGFAVYYPVPLHLQPVFAGLGYQAGAFPHAEKAAEEVLSLPVGPELDESSVRRVAEAVREALAS